MVYWRFVCCFDVFVEWYVLGKKWWVECVEEIGWYVGFDWLLGLWCCKEVILVVEC